MVFSDPILADKWPGFFHNWYQTTMLASTPILVDYVFSFLIIVDHNLLIIDISRSLFFKTNIRHRRTFSNNICWPCFFHSQYLLIIVFPNLVSDYAGRFKLTLVNVNYFLSNIGQPCSFNTKYWSIMVFSFAILVDKGPSELDTCRPVFCFKCWSTTLLLYLIWVIHCHFIANIGQSWSFDTHDWSTMVGRFGWPFLF